MSVDHPQNAKIWSCSSKTAKNCRKASALERSTRNASNVNEIRAMGLAFQALLLKLLRHDPAMGPSVADKSGCDAKWREYVRDEVKKHLKANSILATPSSEALSKIKSWVMKRHVVCKCSALFLQF